MHDTGPEKRPAFCQFSFAGFPLYPKGDYHEEIYRFYIDDGSAIAACRQRFRDAAFGIGF